jgi:hypothetical protein
MKVLSTEKSRLLADQNGWSLVHAQGYVDGETSRRLGKTPSLHVLVGIDEYSLGFRAGYFERQAQESHASRSGPHSPRREYVRAG